jgi:hypothetical protein
MGASIPMPLRESEHTTSDVKLHVDNPDATQKQDELQVSQSESLSQSDKLLSVDSKDVNILSDVSTPETSLSLLKLSSNDSQSDSDCSSDSKVKVGSIAASETIVQGYALTPKLIGYNRQVSSLPKPHTTASNTLKPATNTNCHTSTLVSRSETTVEMPETYIQTIAGNNDPATGSHLCDGSFDMARFAAPRGMHYMKQSETLLLCDNHCVRTIHLRTEPCNTCSGTRHDNHNSDITATETVTAAAATVTVTADSEADSEAVTATVTVDNAIPMPCACTPMQDTFVGTIQGHYSKSESETERRNEPVGHPELSGQFPYDLVVFDKKQWNTWHVDTPWYMSSSQDDSKTHTQPLPGHVILVACYLRGGLCLGVDCDSVFEVIDGDTGLHHVYNVWCLSRLSRITSMAQHPSMPHIVFVRCMIDMELYGTDGTDHSGEDDTDDGIEINSIAVIDLAKHSFGVLDSTATATSLFLPTRSFIPIGHKGSDNITTLSSYIATSNDRLYFVADQQQSQRRDRGTMFYIELSQCHTVFDQLTPEPWKVPGVDTEPSPLSLSSSQHTHSIKSWSRVPHRLQMDLNELCSLPMTGEGSAQIACYEQFVACVSREAGSSDQILHVIDTLHHCRMTIRIVGVRYPYHMTYVGPSMLVISDNGNNRIIMVHIPLMMMSSTILSGLLREPNRDTPIQRSFVCNKLYDRNVCGIIREYLTGQKPHVNRAKRVQ